MACLAIERRHDGLSTQESEQMRFERGGVAPEAQVEILSGNLGAMGKLREGFQKAK